MSDERVIRLGSNSSAARAARSGARARAGRCAARRSSPRSWSCCSRRRRPHRDEPHLQRQDARSRHAPSSAKQYVKTAHRRRPASAGQTLALPGTLQGYVQAPISARASGYLKRWHKDIGSRREERRSARRDRGARDRPAALAGGRRAPAGGVEPGSSRRARWSAGKRCARRTPCRSRSSTSAAAPRRRRAPTSPPPTRTSSACARLQGFKRVVAPFSGVITRRNVDVGDLIDAGGGAGARCSCCRRPTRCASTSTCRRPTRSS